RSFRLSTRKQPEPSLTSTSRRPVKLPVNVRIPQNRLHILASLSKRNRFHELLWITILPLSQPVLHPIRPRVVCGESIFERAKLIDHGTEIFRAQLQINSRLKQLGGGEMLQLLLLGNVLANFRQQLHESQSIRARYRIRIEFRFLPNQRCNQIRVKRIAGRKSLEIKPVWLREQSFPIGTGKARYIDCEIIRYGML